MSKLYNPNEAKEKVNKIVKEELPVFAAMYFRSKANIMSYSSLYAYALDLESFFDYIDEVKAIPISRITIRDLDSITATDIENYLVYSKEFTEQGIIKTRSSYALSRRFYVLRSFYKFFYTEGLINTLPTIKLDAPQILDTPKTIPTYNNNSDLINFIENDSLPGLRAGAHQNNYRCRDAAIVALMAYAGLKISEIIELKISDISLETGYISISKRKYSHLKVTDYVIRKVSAYLVKRQRIIAEYGHENILFLSSQCAKMSIRSIQIMVKKYTTALFGNNIRITPKDLRFSFINNVYNASHSISDTMLLSGNSPITLEAIYCADLEERQANSLADPI